MYRRISPQPAIGRVRNPVAGVAVALIVSMSLVAGQAQARAAGSLVGIAVPRANQVVAGEVGFKASVGAASRRRVRAVRFFVDGRRIGVDRRWPFSLPGVYFDTRKLGDGRHVFTVVAEMVRTRRTAKAGSVSGAKAGSLRASVKVKVNNGTSEASAESPATTDGSGADGTATDSVPVVELEPIPPDDEPVPPPSPDPLGVAGDWSLIFSDEFDGQSIDRGRWNDQRDDWLTGGVPYSNLEGASYAPENVTVTEGSLATTIRRRDVDGFRYTTGDVNTNHRFSFRYGYVEARLHIPSCDGCWPAFWMLSDLQTWPPEVDILEMFDTAINRFPVASLHWSENGAHVYRSVAYGDTATDHTGGWHTFGLRWDSAGVQPFVDGVPGEVIHDTTGAATLPMYLILGLQVGNGHEPADGATMYADYVRVWQPAGA